MTEKFPVIMEKALHVATKRLLRGAKRDPNELPAQEPGTVLVFEVAGRHEVFKERRHLAGTEPNVVNAVAVSVVSVRPREVSVEFQIPSASPADQFTMIAWFRCQVTEPKIVAMNGTDDVVVLLRSHLRQDRRLMILGETYTIDQVNMIRREADDRISAFCEIQPPEIAGMKADLLAVTVLDPVDLVRHGQALRDERWRQELETLANESQDREIERLATYLSDPERAAALGLHRREMNMSQLVEMSYAERHRRNADLLEVLRILDKNGQLDRLPFDGAFLIDALTRQLTGNDAERGTQPTAIPNVRSEPTQDTGRALEGEDRYVPDDDDIAG